MPKLILRNLPFVFAMTLAGSIVTTPALSQSTSELSGWSCGDLWTARNNEYSQVGYCFKGARGKREFGNGGCSRNESEARRAMGSENRAYVDRIKRVERAEGC